MPVIKLSPEDQKKLKPWAMAAKIAHHTIIIIMVLIVALLLLGVLK